MNGRLRTIRLHLEPDPSGVYTVTSPDVPGLVTEGRTPAEIQANVQDALAALWDAWQALGVEPPPALRTRPAEYPRTVEALVTV